MTCLTCLNLSGERPISPAPFIYEGTYRVVDHAYPTKHLGWPAILPRRHVEPVFQADASAFRKCSSETLPPEQIMPTFLSRNASRWR